jgi:hypothetical protein
MSNIPTYAQTTTVLHITCIHNLPFYICTKSGTPQCWCMLQHLLRVLHDSTPQMYGIALLHSLSCGCSLLHVVESRKTNLACTNSVIKRARAVHDVQKSFPSPHSLQSSTYLTKSTHQMLVTLINNRRSGIEWSAVAIVVLRNTAHQQQCNA